MTPQTVTTFDFIEIPALEIVCNCGSRISIPLPQQDLPESADCLGCKRQLWGSAQDQSRLRVLGMLKSFTSWRDLQNKKFALEFSIKQSVSQK
jgi:hypothetical protein